MIEPVGCFIVPDGFGILCNMPKTKGKQALLFISQVEVGNSVLLPIGQDTFGHLVGMLDTKRSASTSLSVIILKFTKMIN